MSTICINGRKLAISIKKRLKKKMESNTIKPTLAVIIVGEDPASVLYVRMKRDACHHIGIKSNVYALDDNVSEKEITELIKILNNDDDTVGILVQLPLPTHMNKQQVLDTISPNKDVDGLTTANWGKLFLGNNTPYMSCTPKGIIYMLDEYKIPIEGQNVVIINHSNLIGKPLATMFLNRNATVTICHQYTKNLHEHTKSADILVTAVGHHGLINKTHLKKGVIVIDAGICKVDNKLKGDCNPDIKEVCSAYTPVPGGVGPMTVAMLLENTVMNFYLTICV